MSKKDRTAIVISILYLIIMGSTGFHGMSEAGVVLILTLVPPLAYWGHRFIKNDISILKAKNINTELD